MTSIDQHQADMDQLRADIDLLRRDIQAFAKTGEAPMFNLVEGMREEDAERLLEAIRANACQVCRSPLHVEFPVDVEYGMVYDPQIYPTHFANCPAA